MKQTSKKSSSKTSKKKPSKKTSRKKSCKLSAKITVRKAGKVKDREQKHELTLKQIAFCKEYPVDFNGSAAVIRAGYSEKGARQMAAILLTNINIQDYLQKNIDNRMMTADVTVESVLLGLKRTAFADVRKLFDETGQLKKITELDDDTALAISGVEINDLIMKGWKIGETRKIKFGNRTPAQELLGKYLDIFGTDKIGEIDVNLKVSEDFDEEDFI